jgi:hypothetical protein
MTPMPVRAARLARWLTLGLALVGAIELIVSRGGTYVRHERLREGLPRVVEWWYGAGTYVTTFTGLLAAATILALGLRLAVSRFPAAGRGLALGFAVTIAALGLTAVFVPPEVRGILTVHLAVVMGAMTLGLVLLVSPIDGSAKVLAVTPALLPPLATAALAVSGSGQAVLRIGLVAAGVLVAAVLVVTAVRRARTMPRVVLLTALAHALLVGCLAATAIILEPRRAVEFVLFSHGVLLDFRGALAILAVVVPAVAFASAVLVLSPPRDGIGADGGRMMGFGLVLAFLAGPSPLNVTQSLLLAAGSLALTAGALEEWTLEPVFPPTASIEPLETPPSELPPALSDPPAAGSD